MAKQNSTEKKIHYRIIDIKKLSYFENDLNKLDPKKIDLNSGNYDVRIGLGTHPDNGIIAVNLSVKFHISIEDKNVDLFGMEALYKFQVKNFKGIFKIKNNNEVELPDNFLKVLLEITISGVRGMIAVSVINPIYQKTNLPLMRTDDILNLIKKEKKS